jgi:membrane associated rhomboid family serine protease
MFFPFRDHNPSGRMPFVCWTLIAANILIFLGYWLTLPNEYALSEFYFDWGLVPRRALAGQGFETVVTSMFLHGGWMHLAGNMLFLWVFGDNLEDQMGHGLFAAFYLAGGAVAGAAQVVSEPSSLVPMVGASGAIAAVLGGYLLLFPKARVDVFIFLLIYVRVLPVPAWIVLGIWFGTQVFSGVTTPAGGGGVAYWAHAGGFIMGLGLALPLWLARGGVRFWGQTHGVPPHPEAQYETTKTRIPMVRRMR